MQHRLARSLQPAEKSTPIRDQDAMQHRLARSLQPAEKATLIREQNAMQHRNMYKSVKADNQVMHLARNTYMQQVVRDCAAGVAPAPLDKQPFTQYFMTQWSDRQTEWRIPEPCNICHGAWPIRDSKPKPTSTCISCTEIGKKRAKSKSKSLLSAIHPLSSENGMVPTVSYTLPNDLPVLSEFEEMFIARTQPIMACYRKKADNRV